MEVNTDVYIDRPELERELKRAIEGSMHVVVHGESGSGKSWLYKKVLADLAAHVVIANSSNAARFASLSREVASACGLQNVPRKVGYSETKEATGDAVVASATLSHTNEFVIDERDPLLASFALMRSKAGSKPAVLVVDNLELILASDVLMSELASIITLLDDKRFAEHGVRLLLVGVPSVIRDYFARTPSFQSVTNRLQEVSEVTNLQPQQVAQLVEKGFRKLLAVTVSDDDLAFWQQHIFNVTMGFAQAVQEYCEQLGYIVEDADWHGDSGQLRTADANWLKAGLNAARVAVAARMNERETRVGRRNQVLFALGKLTALSFTANSVEVIVRREFPDSTENTTLAIGQILGELAGGNDPLIKQTARGNEYEFKDARIAMALRVLLEKEPQREKVRRVQPNTLQTDATPQPPSTTDDWLR